jgi:tryptophan 2,3-dioxygenase
MEQAMTLTYSSYLKLDELLELQQLQSKGKAHDEMLFVVIHQTYELWFKEVLYELDGLCAHLEHCDITAAQFTFHRILAILKLLVHQMDVLETMSAPQFLAFRDFLGTASGFQSAQFRELELVLGNRRPEAFMSFPEGAQSRRRLELRYASATLWDYFLRCLAALNYSIPEQLLHRDFTQPVAPSQELQLVLCRIYSESAELSYICEQLLDLDEGFQEWRYRHVKMVERIIGSKQGTGGSSGVEYLKSTLFKPSFPDLWEIRTHFKKP